MSDKHERWLMQETPKWVRAGIVSAEAAYREHSQRRSQQDAYAAVRVQNGQAVIEELYVDDRPIREFLKQ